MGVKGLLKFVSHCKRQTNLSELNGKTLLVDTSIYMYRFLKERSLYPDMLTLMNLFNVNNITPIFVFDGTYSEKKKSIIKERNRLRQNAQKKYEDLSNKIETDSSINNKERKMMESKLEKLKKSTMKLSRSEINIVKSLIEFYGYTYIQAKEEADEMCVYLMNMGISDYVMSDDNDMFVYGCKHIVQSVNLFSGNCTIYNIDDILMYKGLSMDEFRTICILNGTDYNTHLHSRSLNIDKLYIDFKSIKSSESEEGRIDVNTFVEKYGDITEFKEIFEMFVCSDNVTYFSDYDSNLLTLNRTKKPANITEINRVLSENICMIRI